MYKKILVPENKTFVRQFVHRSFDNSCVDQSFKLVSFKQWSNHQMTERLSEHREAGLNVLFWAKQTFSKMFCGSTAKQSNKQARVSFIAWCHLFWLWGGHHVTTLIYVNLQTSIFEWELFSDSPLPIHSYSTMSSTLLQEEYPLSVDFVGLPEICTSYISNQAAKGSFLKKVKGAVWGSQASAPS